MSDWDDQLFSYPRFSKLDRLASAVSDRCHTLEYEIAEHNPSMPVSAARAFENLVYLTNELRTELSRLGEEGSRQRMIYRRLIEKGECP